MNYILLATAIILEVIGTSLLKKTNGFTELLPTILLISCYSVAFYLLSLVVKTIPIGIAYAIWSAGGIVLVSAFAYFLYGQKLDLPAVIGLFFIVVGVVVINIFSKSVEH